MSTVIHSPTNDPTGDSSDRPTLIKCVKFEGKDGRINIPQQIGVKFRQFGLFLLEDDTGDRIQFISNSHIKDAEQINMEVLQQWINGKGKHPATWKTLTDVLHDIELHTLAREIELTKFPEHKL